MRDRLRKTYDPDIKQADDDRAREFVVSTARVDREGDRIVGWDLRNFRKNPVVLWSHQRMAPPIAKATSVVWTGEKLRSTAQFPPPGTHAFADTVLEMIDAGLLNASSVGFQPLEGTVEPNSFGGFDMSAELLEWSVVPVPANPGALIEEAKGAGIDPAPLRRRREQLVKRCSGPACGLQDGRDAAGELVELLDAERAAGDAELMDELLTLTSDELGEAVAASLRDEWRKQVTPLDGSLGP